MVRDQCPHPWPCYGHARLEDTADNLAVRNHVEIVVVPLAGRPTKRRPFEQVVFVHRLYLHAQIRFRASAGLAIAYSRVGTGRTPSAVPSSSNFPASHWASEPGLIAQSCRAFSSPLGRHVTNREGHRK